MDMLSLVDSTGRRRLSAGGHLLTANQCSSYFIVYQLLTYRLRIFATLCILLSLRIYATYLVIRL